MSEDAVEAEFDTVAEWTAEAAVALGLDHYVPAGCRGRGGPAALDWLLDRPELAMADQLVDVGAGVGGPAAYAVQRHGVRPMLFEPAAGALARPSGCSACRPSARMRPPSR